ncbi:MAG: hypothetical protein KKD28_15535, partial [Chloroflexi bacterium]|nr:hypothetical protein [Chloroflexota bacterium]
ENTFWDFNIYNALNFAEIFALAGDQKGIRVLRSKLAAYFERLAGYSQTISPDLSRLLADLPSQKASQTNWGAYHRDLSALAIQHHDIGHQWELSSDQTQRVEQYLRANQLLVDCLDVAYVNDREGILERVLTVD